MHLTRSLAKPLLSAYPYSVFMVFGCFWCVGLVALLHFCWVLCGWKNANVLPIALGCSFCHCAICAIIVQFILTCKKHLHLVVHLVSKCLSLLGLSSRYLLYFLNSHLVFGTRCSLFFRFLWQTKQPLLVGR